MRKNAQKTRKTVELTDDLCEHGREAVLLPALAGESVREDGHHLEAAVHLLEERAAAVALKRKKKSKKKTQQRFQSRIYICEIMSDP